MKKLIDYLSDYCLEILLIFVAIIFIARATSYTLHTIYNEWYPVAEKCEP